MSDEPLPPGARLTVEFVGVPGAGKSAVSRRVVGLLRERGFAVDDLSYQLARNNSRAIRSLKKSVHVAREVTLHPLYTLKATRQVASIRYSSFGTLAKMILNWVLVSALARRGTRKGIHVYDQAIFQGFWSMGFGGGPEAVGEAAHRLWSLMPAPDLVVVVEADRAAIIHRLRMRKERKSRLDRLFETQPGVLEHCAALLDATTRALEEIRARDASVGAVVLRCERDSDIDRESRRLLSLIEPLLTRHVSKGAALAGGRP